MSEYIYINTPAGATHMSDNGHFYKAYSSGWLVWDTYHKSWRHTDTIVRVKPL